MKQNYYLIVLFLLVFNHSFATYVFQVSSVDPLTGGQTYQINQTANPLGLSINVCAFGSSQPQEATFYTLSWYRNTVNSTVGGVLVSSATQSTPNAYNIVDIKTYLPSTSQAGTFYYYAVLSNPTATSCGFTGTLTSTIQRVDVFAPATHLNFGGSNDYVDCGNSPSLQITGNTITLEAYVKFNTFASDPFLGNIINKNSNTASGYMLRAGGNGVVNFVVANNSFYEIFSPQNSISLNTWHHIAGVYNGVNLKIYVDGVEVASQPLSVTIGNANINLNIGRDPDATNRNLDASLDDVRVWNVARTAEQINGSKNCELQGNETGLVANYKFNQGLDAADNTSITTLTDATANGNNGTLVNFTKTGTTSNFLAGSPVTTGSIIPSVATVTTPVTYTQGATATALTATTGANGTSLVWYTAATGGSGATTAPTPSTATVGSTSYWVSSTNANGCESARTEIVVTVIAPATHLNFDGVNDYVELPNESNYDFTTNLTIEFRVRTSNLNVYTSFVSKGNGSWRVQTSGDGLIAYAANGAFVDFKSTTRLDDNNWHHVAVTYDGAFARIYIDGVLENSRGASGTITNTSHPVVIGAMRETGPAGRYLNGDIDEVRIWNKALSASDILALKDCELQSAETGLVGYYKFNQGNDSADNTTITTLTDASGNANNGTLTNFARTGTTSNFLMGSPIVTGTTCTTLNTPNFEVANNIKMYPNPTNGIFAIETQEDSTVEVFDMIGKKVYSNKVSVGSSNIDLSNYTNGIYLLTVTNQKGNLNTFKLIKQ